MFVLQHQQWTKWLQTPGQFSISSLSILHCSYLTLSAQANRTRCNFTTTTSCRTVSDTRTVPTTLPSEPILSLRPYQKSCIDACLQALKEGAIKQAISLPVGSGKTVIMANLVERVPPNPTSGATKVLFCAHRAELLNQALRHFQRSNPHLKIGVTRSKKTADPDCDVVIASVPTLGREGTKRLNRLDPSDFKCVLIDEAHHAASSTYERLLDHFQDVPVLGFSATWRRHDGLSLERFQHISYFRHIQEMIDEGYLCEIKFSQIDTKLEVKFSKGRTADYTETDLNQLNSPERNAIIVEVYKEQAILHNRRASIVFALNVAHIGALVLAFNEAGIYARGLHGGTPEGERNSILAEFVAEKLPVLINCSVLTEGVDLPITDCILLTRPTKSSVVLQQSIGRGLRLYEGKKYCLVLDFVDIQMEDIHRATVPSLLGLSAEELDAQELEEAEESVKEHPVLANDDEQEDEGTSDDICLDDLGRLERLKYSLSTTLDPFRSFVSWPENQGILKLTNLSWIPAGKGTWMIVYPESKGAKSSIHIKKSGENEFDVHIRTIRRTPPPRSVYITQDKMLCKHDDMQSAFHAAETFLKSKLSHWQFKGLSRYSKWRTSSCTPNQRAILAQLNLNADDLDKIKTRGHASDLISYSLSKKTVHMNENHQNQ